MMIFGIDLEMIKRNFITEVSLVLKCKYVQTVFQLRIWNPLLKNGFRIRIPKLAQKLGGFRIRIANPSWYSNILYKILAAKPLEASRGTWEGGVKFSLFYFIWGRFLLGGLWYPPPK